MVELFRPPPWSPWVIATIGLITLVGRAFIEEVSSVIYSIMIGMSWVGYSYFEGLILFFFGVPILLVVDISLGVFLMMMILGDSVPRRMIPSFRSGVDDGCVSRDVTDVYYLNFLIGTILNEVTLLSTF